MNTDPTNKISPLRGTLPSDLDGTFLRIGSNPRFSMESKPFHVFDGDGMIHSVSFSPSDNTFSYRNRWVRSKRLLSDDRQRYSFAEIGEMDFISQTGDFDALVNQVDPESGERMGKANTALVVHGGMLLALEENDKPYEISLPSLRTLGRRDFGGRLKHNFTAHPKVDPVDGEMMFFGYNIMGGRVSPGGHGCPVARCIVES